MEEKVRKYILGLGDISDGQKNKYIERFARNADIMNEFGEWIENGEFVTNEKTVVVDGYSAVKIAEVAPALEGLGVYNFLIDLRENPEEAKKAITEGFVIR